MQKEIRERAADYLVRNHRHRTWLKVVSALACVVVFCTVYVLILPALTLENTTYCGFEAHQHTEKCYETVGTYICGMEEGEGVPGHVHTEECCETVLICEKEEHIHELSCYSNPEADVETSEDWSGSVSGVELTGNWRSDLIAVAESQLGYAESRQNYVVAEDHETKKGYTRYGAWYGDPYGDWNAMFAAFCLNYAKVENFPLESSCSRWVEALEKEESDFYRAKGDYIPETGDLIFFDLDDDGKADRVGIMTQWTEDAPNTPAKLKIIEGDADNCVKYSDCMSDDSRILGFAKVPEEARAEYRWSQDGMEVLMSVPQDEALPENASLVVKQLTPEDDESGYEEKYAASQEELAAEESAAISYFDLFRVSLQAEGEEILPQKEATLEIRLLEDEYPVTPHMEVYQYSEDGAPAPASDLREEAGSLTGSFDAALSGEYAIVGTQALSDDAPISGARDAQEETVLTPHKTIDAFRDGGNNPDTTLDNQNIDQTDLYRLYLDAELSTINNPIDLLIVVDQSGSMHKSYDVADPNNNPYFDMTKENGADAYRDEALRLVLNGYSDTDQSVYEQYKKNGLIYQFLAANDQNQVAVVGFQGAGYINGSLKYGTRYRFKETDGQLDDVTSGKIQTNGSGGSIPKNVSSGIADADGYYEAATLLDWTSDAKFVDVQGIPYNATNYTAGFIQAQRELDDAKVKDDGRQKVILFLSDGIPTCYIAEQQKRVGGSIFNPVYGHDYYYRGGNGNSIADGTDDATKTAFNTFITAQTAQGTVLHTLSICATDAEQRLQDMATAGGGQCFSVTTTDELRTNLKKLMFGTVYSQMTIKDTLSPYVDLYDGQPDFKVTRKEIDGSVTVLYENGAVTDAGKGVIKSVAYDSGTKTVTALFEPTYTPPPGTTVTLSFNVQTNRRAYQEYAKNGYQAITGEENTDYGGNATSSNLPGFHSNALATVTYKKDDTPDVSQNYPHPVVQTATCKVAVQKTDSKDAGKLLPDAEFTLYRKTFTGETGDTLEGLNGSYVKMAEQLKTDANGLIIIDNLIPGDYCLVETKAPDHYKKPSAPIPFTLSRKTDGTGQIKGSERTIEIGGETLPLLQVTNVSWGYKLPETGGAGTIPYTIGGLLAIMLAGRLLYRKNKRGKEDFASS